MTKCAPTFNGVDLSDYLTMTNELDRGIGTGRVNELLDVGKADFKQYRGYRLDSKTIAMPFKMLFNLPEKRRELAGILNVSEPVPLIFPDEPDLYYLATPDGVTGLNEQFILGSGTINWMVPDGVAHAINPKVFSNIPKGSTGKNLVLDPEFKKKNKYWKTWAMLLNEQHDGSNILRGDFSDPTAAENAETRKDHWFSRSESTARIMPNLKQGDPFSLAVDIRIMKAVNGDTTGAQSTALILEEWDRIGGQIVERHILRPTTLKLGDWQQLKIVDARIKSDRTTVINLTVGVYNGSIIDMSRPQLNVGNELLDYAVSDVNLTPDVEIENNGSYKAHPIIRARMNGENGLVAFVKDNGGILQFGNPEESDIIEGVRSDKVIDYGFRGGQPELTINDGGITELKALDFKNKVSGSISENPHSAYFSQATDVPLPPITTGEISTANYLSIASNDGKLIAPSVNVANRRMSLVAKFNVVSDIERKYPWVFDRAGAVSPSEKLALTRKIVDGTIRPVAYASGSGASTTDPGISRAQVNMQIWSGTAWQGGAVNTSNNIAMLEYKNQTGQRIQDDGFVYIVLYAPLSDGIAASVLNVDYIGLEYKIISDDIFIGVTTYPNYVSDPERPNLVQGTINWVKDPEAAIPEFVKNDAGVWAGPRMWGDIPRNSANDNTGDFIFKNRFVFNTNVITKGRIEFVLQNKSEVAFAMVMRDSTGTKDEVTVECHFGNQNLKSISLDRKIFTYEFWEMQISRSGTKIEYKISAIDQLKGETVISAKYQTFVVDMMDKAYLPVTGQTTWFEKFSNESVATMRWTDCKFTWVNTPTYKNIPNLFDDGDLLEIDVKERKVAVNGAINNQLHALGNNWEMFAIEKEFETIRPIASSWATMFEVEVELREAFL